jgi:flagellar biosynthesis protein FliQ
VRIIEAMPAVEKLLISTVRLVAICTVGLGVSVISALAQQHDSTLLEKTRFDWDRSGTPTTF